VGNKAGGKGKKIGRSKRKPSHEKYVKEKRWIENKKKKKLKEEKRQQKFKERKERNV